ncbi:MAG: hypothetical protein WC521_08585 [Bdellovibrionales bacterium]|jgi:flagellar biosynthesis/type III secretory pathway chaperone
MSPKDKNIARALAGSPKLVIATVAIMEELTRVLGEEAALVKKRKTTEHPDLLKHKQRLAIDYRANMKSFAAQPEILKTLPDEAKDAVREMSRRLAVALDSNARMLRAAMEATRQLIQNVMAMVKKQALSRQTYKNHAKAHLQLGNYSPLCRSIAINRTV